MNDFEKTGVSEASASQVFPHLVTFLLASHLGNNFKEHVPSPSQIIIYFRQFSLLTDKLSIPYPKPTLRCCKDRNVPRVTCTCFMRARIMK